MKHLALALLAGENIDQPTLMERVMEKKYEKKESFLPIFLVITGFLLFAISVVVQIAFISS